MVVLASRSAEEPEGRTPDQSILAKERLLLLIPEQRVLECAEYFARTSSLASI